MVSQAELILRVITLWFLVLSQFLGTVWVALKSYHVPPNTDNIIREDIVWKSVHSPSCLENKPLTFYCTRCEFLVLPEPEIVGRI